MPLSKPFRDALRRILRPVVRLLIARGVRFPELAEILKEIYVDASGRYFRLDQKRLTDSRISLLTGLQRKDIKGLRAALDAASPDHDGEGQGLLPRVLAHWSSAAPYADADGNPQVLPRTGETPSFAALVAEVSRDIHPRTVLDEFVRLGLAKYDKERDEITPLKSSFLPSRDETALLGYFGANLGDHAEAAARNLLAAPDPGPFFERAVHYNELTDQSVDELEELARKLQGEALARLNARALELQRQDTANDAPKGRFRCGAFIYRSSDATSPRES